MTVLIKKTIKEQETAISGSIPYFERMFIAKDSRRPNPA